ncbi:hypothetical protein RCH18_000049 [Flavobacterium sp. PL11]|jgi:hypothetical protein|uniref:SPOR domain-containing protein n=1 Tax=Flavobacterium sp. PL11 TaxID=3071717 RepID=UPI002E03CEB0|nr:hypothetical protein [Flavobacterium sp. PL11]
MRILAISNTSLTSLFITLATFTVNAQVANINIKQDIKFEQLLNERRKNTISPPTDENYQIQIYSGDSQKAKLTLNEFRQEFKDVDATIFFFTPNYKVWVGNYSSRIEAERNLVNIRKRYSNVHLIKPKK